MTLGEPRVAVSALLDLKRLLKQYGSGSSCHDSFSTIGEKNREKSIDTACDVSPGATAVEDSAREPRPEAVEHCRAVSSRRPTGQPAAARRRRSGEGAK